MAIDVFGEEVVSLSQAAKKLPKVRGGKHPHVSTLYRWVIAGKKCPDGSIAHLESLEVGGTTCTSLEALQRVFDRLTGDRDIVTPPTITSRERLRHIEEAEAYLDSEGA